jgi:3-keto-L-gulonate-6-phosphate decarboxylase
VAVQPWVIERGRNIAVAVGVTPVHAASLANAASRSVVVVGRRTRDHPHSLKPSGDSQDLS